MSKFYLCEDATNFSDVDVSQVFVAAFNSRNEQYNLAILNASQQLFISLFSRMSAIQSEKLDFEVLFKLDNLFEAAILFFKFTENMITI